MAIHPPLAATVNGRRYAPPKPEMTASASSGEIRSIQKFSSPMVSVSRAAAAAHHQSGQTGTGWSLHAYALSGIADIFRVIKNTTYSAPDCSPDVMVADVPMYPRIFHRRGQWQHRTGYRNQPQRLRYCILARPRSVISAATPAENGTPFPAAQMPQPHPAWREVISMQRHQCHNRDQISRISHGSGCADTTSFSCPVSAFSGLKMCPDRQRHPCHQAPLPALPTERQFFFRPRQADITVQLFTSERRRAISSSFVMDSSTEKHGPEGP